MRWHGRCTFRVRLTSGAGKSVKQEWGGSPQVGAPIGKHLHRSIDFRSYDSESTRGWFENSGAGVPGVAGADAGVPGADSGIPYFDSIYK